MTSYNCSNAKREAGKPLLVCTKSGKSCLNQRYCPQSKQTVLTAYAKDCPGRKEEPAKTDEAPKPKKAARKKKTDGDAAD